MMLVMTMTMRMVMMMIERMERPVMMNTDLITITLMLAKILMEDDA